MEVVEHPIHAKRSTDPATWIHTRLVTMANAAPEPGDTLGRTDVECLAADRYQAAPASTSISTPEAMATVVTRSKVAGTLSSVNGSARYQRNPALRRLVHDQFASRTGWSGSSGVVNSSTELAG